MSFALVIQEINILDHTIRFLTVSTHSRASKLNQNAQAPLYRDTSDDVAPQLLRCRCLARSLSDSK
jgi:hypothetical protein